MIRHAARVLLPVLMLTAGAGNALDQNTADAVQACHNFLWSSPEIGDLDGAAVTAFPESQEDDLHSVRWTVEHDSSTTSGSCTVRVNSGLAEVVTLQHDAHATASVLGMLAAPLGALRVSPDGDPGTLNLHELLLVIVLNVPLLAGLVIWFHWRFNRILLDREATLALYSLRAQNA